MNDDKYSILVADVEEDFSRCYYAFKELSPACLVVGILQVEIS